MGQGPAFDAPVLVFLRRALLLFEFDDLNGVAGHGVMQMIAHALNGAFDRDNLVGMIDGVSCLGIVGCQGYELRGGG